VPEVADMQNISSGSAYAILYDDLGYRKVRAKWVPRQLTNPHKQCMAVATQLLRHAEDPPLLDRTVTGGKMWVHHLDLKSKRESVEWKHLGSPQKKLGSVPSAKKILLTFFWTMKGPVLEHYQDKGQTVNSATYSATVKDKLKPAACYKRRGLLPKTVRMHCDNARPMSLP
jgi:hypothetical protein